MRSRILYTVGDGKFVETSYDKPNIKSTEICVKSIYTGICRSDIDMMLGNFGPLPLGMQGHEGLGEVVEVGEAIVGTTKVGDIVATRGEPAFADYYNVAFGSWVKVPAADPKYIVEPVACAINIANSIAYHINKQHKKILILGSGFLATVVFQTLLIKEMVHDSVITVVGNSNREFWDQHIELSAEPSGWYDIIIDLKDDDRVFTDDLLNANGIYVLAAEKKSVTTTFGSMLWNNITILCPSPRSENFRYAMDEAALWIENDLLKVDNIWTKGYNRDTEWQQAFEDGLNRPPGYSRGYLKWR